MALVVAVLVTLVWLAGRYEISQLQADLERDSADAVSDIRSGLSTKHLREKLVLTRARLVARQTRLVAAGMAQRGHGKHCIH
jgi:CRP-like cAMP-binding protein